MEILFRDCPMTVYRSHTHSFWHDTIENLDTRQKLWRRIQRFRDLHTDATSPQRQLLFIRSCASSAELEDSETLHRLLQQNFGTYGRDVWLLIVVDDQNTTGPILHATNDKLITWMKPATQGRLETGGDGPGPYEEAIGFAIRCMLKDPATLAPQYPRVARCADILSRGSPLLQHGCQETEAGMWCGFVIRKGDTQKTLFCAFEGHSHREIAYPDQQ
jgi:hypothetical protein